MWRVAAATAAFAAVHSALASARAKRAARRHAGDRAVDGWYRPLYNVQALATFGALVAYARRQPDRTLYDVRGAPRALMRGGQLAALGGAAWAVARVGPLTFAGAPGLAAWARGTRDLPPTPEAQGPTVDASGGVDGGGPFALTRHPLNTAFAVMLWLQPRMTANLAAFTALATVHLVAGSRHEEARLAARHGAAYERYRRAGVPFFLPGPARALPPADAGATP